MLRERLQSDWAHLDLLVNNAGVAGAGEVGKFSLDDWRWIIDVNLYNGIYGCHTFVEWLKQNPRGAHIINTASMAAIASAPGMAGYNVSKAGMLALSETLYAELLPHNVGVTVLCPAFFATNLLKQGRWAQDNLKLVAERAFQVSKLTAEHVADQAVRAMHRKQLYVVTPFSSRMHWWIKRLMPQRFFNKVGKLIESANRAAERQAAKQAAQESLDRERETAGHR
jgi:short-subunit dehydrogenase